MNSARPNMPPSMRSGNMRMYTVYHDPSDYPGKYVVRGITISAGICCADAAATYVGHSLNDARANIPEEHSYCVNRHPDDDPVIVETWV